MPGAEQSRLRDRLKISDAGESAYALRCDLDRKRTETLLIIDQFEESLIQTSEEKRAPFVDFLCALADGPFGFRILLTLRADYFNFDDSLQQLRSRLWADGQDAVFRLKRMSDQSLAETTRGPLALVGFPDQAAVDALIQAIQRDVSDREGDLALVLGAPQCVAAAQREPIGRSPSSLCGGARRCAISASPVGELSATVVSRRKFACDDRPEHSAHVCRTPRTESGFKSRLRLGPSLARQLQAFLARLGNSCRASR
jgi:hypothetical protein